MLLKSVIDWRLGFGLLGVGAASSLILLNVYVMAITAKWRFTNIASVPVEEVAIIFGAGVWEDGTPSPMLAQRVQAGVDLYHQGKVKKLLMTGDNSSDDYNEVRAMQLYAEAQGVPAENIQLDYAGFSTYESCYRAGAVFGVKRAILITQRYHLPRAVYTCRSLGVEALGFGTPDWGIFRNDSMLRYSTREFLAVINALLEVHLIKPKPTFL
ncbi:YdcF family protein [Ancylothrix sp. C2]|uniref:SanA/YdcF family protein n=1 Tax=Ancylothrix sp. D3o TaxID=2953691 RepID=UPI0021BBA028|nr:ElyC/SanA/YdcF family protein [Ancylothrix sp. D3o]MCT7948569.1 YdcF family protein [Ancylothrix sp. D3o]